MATLKDIAKLANVSHGTVSNVLNGKGNVSVKKIRQVENAAKQLGYSINAQAQQLRGPSVRSNNIAVIVPDITESKYSCFYSNIKKYYESQGCTVLLFVSEDIPYLEQAAVSTISTMRAKGVITVTCCPNSPEIYAPIKQIGAEVLFAERRPIGSENYIGFDYFHAGEEVASYIIEHGFHSIGLFRNLNIFSNEAHFEKGILNCLNSADYHFELNVVESNIEASLRDSFDFLTNTDTPDIIITSNNKYLEHIKKAFCLGSRKLPFLLALSPKDLLFDENNIKYYFLNYDNLGYHAASALDMRMKKQIISSTTESSEAEFDRELTFLTDGFTNSYVFPHIKKHVNLNYLTVKGQATDALMRTLPSFEKESGIRVNFVIMPPNEMNDTVIRKDSEKFFDVMRINMFTMPVFSHEKFLPLDDAFFHSMTDSMVPKVVNEFSFIGGVPYGIPFDVGTQILIYRKDLFDDPLIKRMYYERFSEPLEIPTDFEQFNRVANFFTKKFNSDSPIRFGSSSSLATNSGICTDFEIRYCSFGGKATVCNHHLQLDDDTVFKALNNYKEYFLYSTQTYDDYWGGENINNFIMGNTAMEIVFSNYASRLTSLKSSKIGGQLGCACIPGNRPYLGGGSINISSHTKESEAAKEFIHWACGMEQAETHTMLGGLSPHSFIFENRQIINLYPWHMILKDSISNCTGRSIFKEINIIEYEKLAGLIIRSVINQNMNPKEALQIFEDNIENCMLGKMNN